ncbi:hypothetical protein [Algoriphagus sediminis]|uniref:Thioredoxin domain-containing protein n=1 Tax=Algoriphagus sediminis TaxID=3057113 RepID=A0ABT7Y8E1_9BACT|nr:hypothetical protein [Algoriphagus sediminis]MDN3202776.1 hypothetical protein [Algoriphagus sediminis]
MRYILFFVLICFSLELLAQTGYRDEMGRTVSREYFEKQILEGPYFGIPYEEGGKILVNRMPFGKVEPGKFFEASENSEAFDLGKTLIVIFYPGKDECNSSGVGDNADSFEKEHRSLMKWAEKYNATAPVYLYSNPSGLEKYENPGIWKQDPNGVFADEFFKFPYPCGSFVVIHPSGNYRAILGGYPLSQVQTALKKLDREYN